MRIPISATLTAAAVLACWMPAFAGTTGTLHGIVRDLFSELPLPGVSVMMCDGTEQVQSSSDKGGFYSFISLTPGPHDVELEKDGYVGLVASGIIVLADQAITVNPSMTPDGSIHDFGRSAAPTLVDSDVSDSLWAFDADGHPSYMSAPTPFDFCGQGRGGRR